MSSPILFGELPTDRGLFRVTNRVSHPIARPYLQSYHRSSCCQRRRVRRQIPIAQEAFDKNRPSLLRGIQSIVNPISGRSRSTFRAHPRLLPLQRPHAAPHQHSHRNISLLCPQIISYSHRIIRYRFRSFSRVSPRPTLNRNPLSSQ